MLLKVMQHQLLVVLILLMVVDLEILLAFKDFILAAVVAEVNIIMAGLLDQEPQLTKQFIMDGLVQVVAAVEVAEHLTQTGHAAEEADKVSLISSLKRRNIQWH